MVFNVKNYNGLPCLHKDGRPFTGSAYLRSVERYPGYDNYDWDIVLDDYLQQARNGVKLFLFNSTCASDFYERLWGDVWTGPDSYDYSHLDRFMEFFIGKCPGAVVMPKLNLFLPKWWEEQHPDEIQRFHDGRISAKYSGESACCRDKVVSLASELWYADMTRSLERYIEYAEKKYGDHIAGYLITGGITHEWGILGSFDFVDYSSPMQRCWKRWVEQRYPVNPPYDPSVIPSKEIRLREEGSFRNPSESQAAIDFQLCLSDLVVGRVIGFCETVKARTAGCKIAATYYGYTMTCREGGLKFLGRYGSGGFQGGHLSMSKLLESPAVDMVTSPFSYQNRRLGCGDLQPHYAETSLIRSGKVSLLQDDNRSWKGYAMKNLDVGYYPEPENYLKQLRRAFARRLCGDDFFYMNDLLGGNYNDKAILGELRYQQEIFERFAERRSQSLAELLVVADEKAIANLALSSHLHLQNVYLQSSEWARAGVPYHVVLVEDAAKMDLSGYRMVMLLNSVVATDAVEKLVSRCRQNGISILFMPASGIIGPDGPDPRLSSRLTGIELTLFREALSENYAQYDDNGIVKEYGAPHQISHLLVSDDSKAEGWSIIIGTDQKALAVKSRGDNGSGFDAYSSVAPLPWSLIGRLAQLAGCHRYSCNGERIWRSKYLLGVHVDDAGTCKVRLPDGETVEESVMGPKGIACGGRQIEIAMERWETAIFLVGEHKDKSNL